MKKALKLKGSPADARAYALKLLSYRARSRKEMLEKLRGKGFDGGLIQETVTHLERTGLINDSTLASDLLKYSMEYKPLGKKGIRMFLAKRGIDKELIDSTISSHSSEMEEKSAGELVDKKLRTLKNYPEHVVKRRLWGMLERRGFSGRVIYKVLNSVL